MVNSNDFRRYSYSADASYAVDAFNQTRSAAAPKLRPDKRRRLSVSPNTKLKSRQELIKEQRHALAQAAVILLTAALALSMLFSVLFTYVRKNELTKNIASIKSDIAVAQSENVSLNAELEALVSVSQIDAYAVDKLGMTRLQPSQIRYIDSAEYRAEASSQAPAE